VAPEGDEAVHRIERIEHEDLVMDDGASDGQRLIDLEIAERPADLLVTG
jgi:hypothetical protein